MKRVAGRAATFLGRMIAGAALARGMAAGNAAFVVLAGCAETPRQNAVSVIVRSDVPVPPAAREDRGVRVLSIRPSLENADTVPVDGSRPPVNGANRITDGNREPLGAGDALAVSAPAPVVYALSEADVDELIPARVPDRAGWARDILKIFNVQSLPPTPSNVCSVIGIVQQESGLQANPLTKGLNKIALKELDRYGLLGKEVVTKLAGVKFSGEKYTLWQRIKRAKTEYELDHVFRDAVAYYKTRYPNLYAMAGFAGGMAGIDDPEQLNMITTAGSMQVSVRFAQEQARFYGGDAMQTREFLYTRYGGMYYGTLRLLGYPASYSKQIYRFADYNLGLYASRNAAVQQQLSELLGIRLALDGDLLSYAKRSGAINPAESESEKAIMSFAGRYAPALDRKTIRDDLHLEKSEAFENTATYAAIKQAYAARFGEPAYARLPKVEIKSPKIRSRLTTEGFAVMVDRKHQDCLAKFESSHR